MDKRNEQNHYSWIEGEKQKFDLIVINLLFIYRFFARHDNEGIQIVRFDFKKFDGTWNRIFEIFKIVSHILYQFEGDEVEKFDFRRSESVHSIMYLKLRVEIEVYELENIEFVQIWQIYQETYQIGTECFSRTKAAI